MRLAFLILLLLPALAMAGKVTVASASRDLAHAISIGDQVLMGNALAQMQGLACGGDGHAAALLGRKYMSGLEEFEPDPDRARPYLAFAASRGVPGAAVDLAILLTKHPGNQESFIEAVKWLRVGGFVDGLDSAQVQLAANALEIARQQYPDADLGEAEAAAAIMIHFLRNGLDAQVAPPCSSR